MKAKLREKYLPMSYRQKEPMIHQFESYRTSIPRYEFSPRSAPCNPPIPTIPRIHKSQIFPTIPFVPNSQPAPSLPPAQPKSSPKLVFLSQPIPLSHVFTGANPSLPPHLSPIVSPFLVSHLSNPILLSQLVDPSQLPNLSLLP